MPAKWDFPAPWDGIEIMSLNAVSASSARYRGEDAKHAVFLFHAVGPDLYCDFASIARVGTAHDWCHELHKQRPALKWIVGGEATPTSLQFNFGRLSELVIRGALVHSFEANPSIWERYLDARVTMSHPSAEATGPLHFGTLREIVRPHQQSLLDLFL